MALIAVLVVESRKMSLHPMMEVRWLPYRDSNTDLPLRRRLYYPLYYKAINEMGTQGSNLNQHVQSVLCYHYTSPQHSLGGVSQWLNFGFAVVG